jgi:hypothetical protein
MYLRKILPVKWNPGTGYTIKLVNPLNGTEVYDESEPFEIKPEGSTYATAGVQSAAGTLAPTGSGAANASAATPSAATPSPTSGAMTHAVPAVAAVAVAGAAYMLA